LFDLEYPLSRAVVIFAGINFCRLDGQTFLGKSFGLGFRTERDDVSLRFDVCYLIQTVTYRATYLLQYGDWIWNQQQIEFYNDQRTFSSKEVGIGLTLNTVNPIWHVNPFIHGYYGSQALIQPKTSESITDPPAYTDEHFNLSAGVFFNIAPKHRILFGLGMNYHSNEQNNSTWIPDLILQFDFVL